MSLAADILAAALATIFLAVGLAKLASAPSLVADFERFGYPGWFRKLTGACEVAGGALLLAGIAAAIAGIAGAAVLLAVMLGAITTHLRAGDHADKLTPPILLLVLLAAEIALRAAR